MHFSFQKTSQRNFLEYLKTYIKHNNTFTILTSPRLCDTGLYTEKKIKDKKQTLRRAKVARGGGGT